MADMTSGVWGNKPLPVTQPFGVYNPSTAYMYAYAANLGWPAGTHVGIDIGMPNGTPIYAAADGVVSQAGPSQYFRPNPVWVEAADNPETTAYDPEVHVYGHLWENVVNVGQAVARGDLLGYSGEQTIAGTRTPDGTGPHLHFERRNADNTRALDPAPLLTGTRDYRAETAGKRDGDGSETDSGVSGLIDRAGSVGARIGLGLLGLVAVAVGIVFLSGRSPLDAIPAARVLKAVAK